MGHPRGLPLLLPRQSRRKTFKALAAGLRQCRSGMCRSYQYTPINDSRLISSHLPGPEFTSQTLQCGDYALFSVGYNVYYPSWARNSSW